MKDAAKTLFRGTRFDVVSVDQPGREGQLHQRQIVRHPGAVVVLPLVTADQVCLIRNLRVAVGQTLLELPAGTREPDEPPEVTALRELREETGFRTGRLEFLQSFFPSPGIMDEEMFLFAAHDLVAGPPEREEGELIENYIVSLSAALSMVTQGDIRDGKTMIGLLLWAHKMDHTR